MEERNRTLGEFIIEHQNSFQYSTGELSRIINSIRLAAKVVNYKVNKAGLTFRALISARIDEESPGMSDACEINAYLFSINNLLTLL